MTNRQVVPVPDRAVSDFLAGMRSRQLPRIVFAVDATASRQPMWDQACHVQAQMFEEAARLGGLEVQLAYYRGAGECRVSPWVRDARTLVQAMTGVMCRAGNTQIGKVLEHCCRVTGLSAVIIIGDAFEERFEEIAPKVALLAAAKVKCLIFQEGNLPQASVAFARMAMATGGAHCRFDAGSPQQLREFLGAAAAWIVGGVQALEDLSHDSGGARLLLTKVSPN